MIAKELAEGWLEDDEIVKIITDGLRELPLDNKRVLVIVPDHTRTMPLPLYFNTIVRNLEQRVKELNFLVALGTHPPMSETALFSMLGISSSEMKSTFRNVRIYNHEWNNPDALTTLGVIPGKMISEISKGLLSADVTVKLNRLILEHDHIIICGPVFPHEVVGFSGGNKYFFPGIAGPDIINLTHWLGALITSYKLIGTRDTPVRDVINCAANLIPRPRNAICSVVESINENGKDVPKVAGLYIGSPEEAFNGAAGLSALRHVKWCDYSYNRVLSILPEMYDELWVGAKGMYKVEPVIADGGEVIIYAPHIHEISQAHGKLIREIGYHVRDYFLSQWDKYSIYPWSVLAHSTHLRGIGTYQNGVEVPRIRVTLATGIPLDVCRSVNLGYCDPNSINISDWEKKVKDGTLLVPHAGEYLYRLKGDNHAIPAV